MHKKREPKQEEEQVVLQRTGMPNEWYIRKQEQAAYAAMDRDDYDKASELFEDIGDDQVPSFNLGATNAIWQGREDYYEAL